MSFLEGGDPGRLAPVDGSTLTGVWAAQSGLSGLFLKEGAQIRSRELTGRH